MSDLITVIILVTVVFIARKTAKWLKKQNNDRGPNDDNILDKF